MNTGSTHSSISVVPSQAQTSAVEALYATAFRLLGDDRFSDAACVFRAMLKAAPTDERAWLGLGACHEKIGQDRLVLELYGAGSVAAMPSVRLNLARARVLRRLDRDAQAREA